MFNNSININKTNNHTNQKSLNIKKDHNIWLSICIFYYRHLHTLYCLYVYSITDIYTVLSICIFYYRHLHTLYCLYVYSITDIYTHCIVYSYVVIHFCDSMWSFWVETNICSFLIICLYMYCRLRSSYQKMRSKIPLACLIFVSV